MKKITRSKIDSLIAEGKAEVANWISDTVVQLRLFNKKGFTIETFEMVLPTRKQRKSELEKSIDELNHEMQEIITAVSNRQKFVKGIPIKAAHRRIVRMLNAANEMIEAL